MNITRKQRIIFLTAFLCLASIGLYFRNSGARFAHPSRTSTNKSKTELIPPSVAHAGTTLGAVGLNKDSSRIFSDTSPIRFINGLFYSAEIATLVARGNPLRLTVGEVEAIQTAYNQLYLRKAAIEAELAKSETISANQCRITVPKYEAQGNEILAAFEDGVENVLGASRTEAFLNEYEFAVRVANFGLGDSEQIIDVTRVVSSSSVQYEISHSEVGMLSALGLFHRDIFSRLTPNKLQNYSHFRALLPKG